MFDIDELQDGIETVARFHEKRYGLKSPFHLSKCGGCGCPAFQQPCLMCGFYPMGIHKGHWSPKEATKEMFCSMVERSGPGGADGTIATWHASYEAQGFRRDVEDAAREASELDVPSASEYWDAVSVNDMSVHRPIHPNAGVWDAIHEITSYVLRDDTGQLAREARSAREAIELWADAYAEEDLEATLAVIDDLRRAALDSIGRARGAGNLRHAVEILDKVKNRIDAEMGSRPRM